jgi:lysophospholipase L1-like esterase
LAEGASEAVLPTAECNEHLLPRNDDNSTSQVTLPFEVNFYGETFTSLWVNNNGNVTFDGPLSTFTPFGLTGTSASIIAPFFGDVDTRPVGSGTVAYGWGDTIYQGHRAFCVNWLNVGYYNNHSDKLNSFQLLLVQREDAGAGDFDIVFNYDSVQWEAGDASGGSGGLGGSPARAGFSNGTGVPGTYYEVPGSGRSGAFLDSSSAGLARTSTDSSQVGRHTWRVRSGAAPSTEYVALGDSFQSGEGTFNYHAGTDTDANRCHRSPDAYPERLVARDVVNLDLAFWACSGAVSADLLNSSPSTIDVPWNDPQRRRYDETTPAGMSVSQSYFDRLSPATKLVTIGIGGNDMQFSKVLSDCVKDTLGDAFIPFHDSSCQQEYAASVDQRLAGLVAEGIWSRVLAEVRREAPFARVVVLGYPRFYVEGGKSNGLSSEYCAGVRIVDQRWINKEIRDTNQAIENAARSHGMQFASIYDTPNGNELCSDADQYFMNGIKPQAGNPPTKAESYHPNSFGHARIADTLTDVLAGAEPGQTVTVLPAQTQTFTRRIVGGATAFFSSIWPGSDVVMTLRSPSGRVITRGTAAADVDHAVGPTYENYALKNPEAGEWTIELYGARVAAQGEPTRLDVYQPPVMNKDPKPVVRTAQNGRTVTVDASSSTDSDGTIQEYLWEFGDGTTATGVRATHTYSRAGDYLVTLAVRDNAGGEGYASASGVLTIPRYAFNGFQQPVDNLPARNLMTAGRAVPLKFSLGGNYGLGVIAGGAPAIRRVDCSSGVAIDEVETTTTAGSSALAYDASTDTYTYTWKTAKSWAGSCQELTLALDDGSNHRALFQFR